MVKSNKLFKILAVVLIVFTLMSFINAVNAAALPLDATQIMPSNPGGNADSKIKTLSNSILWIIQAVGIAAGVVIIAYMGIKYITSSPDGKAEIKKQAYVYILGAAFLILAPTIANIVFTTVNK